MTTKQQLINYLETTGKTHTWRELYDMFPYNGTNVTAKQKSDFVRRLYNRKIKQNLVQVRSSKSKLPKILLFDLETSPKKAYVWRLWKENINPVNGQLQSEMFLLTWSAKWLFDEDIMSDKLTSKEVLEEDDSRLVRSMWNLFDEADVVIGHYALGFDVKVMNTRFLKQGLTPPSPYQVIDTKYHAARHFLLESNKLDYLGKFLGVGRKIDTGGFELWERCMRGDESALIEMEEYNKQDVTLLEDVYLALRPYIKPHPNLNLIIGNNITACPKCMSKELEWSGTYRTQVSSYDTFKCKCCGSHGRSRTSSTNLQVRKNLIVSV